MLVSRITFEIEDDLNTKQTIYDGASRVVETVDALGNRQVMAYDKNDNLIETNSIELSPEGLVADEIFTAHYVYDQLDRRVRVTDNDGRTARYAHDSRDNVTVISDAVGADLAVDPLGLFPGSINEPGNTTTLHYDGRDLAVMEVHDLRVGGRGDGILDSSNPFNADGQIVVQYLFDRNSRQVALIDDNGNATQYTYDAQDRRVSQTNADATQYLYSYDRDNNRVRVVDPNGTQVMDKFDVLNRLVQRDVIPGSGVIGTTREIYGYDGLSRLTFSSDNNGGVATTHSLDRIYDSLSRLLEEQQDAEPYSNVWSGDGNRLQLTYPTSRSLDYEYDSLNRLKRVTDLSPAVFPGNNIGRAPALAVVDYSWIGPHNCECQCPCDDRALLVGMGNNTQLSYLDDTGGIAIGYDAV